RNGPLDRLFSWFAFLRVSLMTALDVVSGFEQSAIGQFFVTVSPSFVVVFQLVHIFGFLSILTSITLLALRSTGHFSIIKNDERFGKSLFALAAAGVTATVLSGAALFLTSATHYFTNAAMPYKLLLLVLALVIEFSVFRRLFLRGDGRTSGGKFVALTLVLLWFATGFAGRAIGFV
ncbi:MAG TPA: hypothetical protein VFM46_12690, partial [Pseudomonadales bacterium]|nr:hypothetical protein [Pseudomonadales bacterium]